MSANTVLDHTRRVAATQIENNPVYGFLLRDAAIIEASEGLVRAQLTLAPVHVNSRGSIHGAVTAALVDWSGSLAIVSHGMEKTGPSVDIHITYISTAVVGDVIEIVGTASKVGQSLGFTSVVISKLRDGKPVAVVAKGSHTKYIRNATRVADEREAVTAPAVP
jgi:acyl-coenzyme A thioesterase 13